MRSAPGGVVVFALVIEKPDGSREEQRIPATTYRKLIAATNMKQRVRKLIEYTWADSLGYAVIGTPNRLEYDQGFFVKGGDGLADIKPIARLYKTQVYALARHLGLPAAIAERDPTTETFSLPQTQEEFYFGHPYDRMDLLVHGVEEGIAPADLAPLVGMDAEGVAKRLRRGAARAQGDRLPARRAPASSTSTARTTRPAADVCGIAGILHADSARPVDEPTLRRMAGAIRHRGPDGYGIASGGGAGLVSTRLAIFDIPSGWQPMQGAHRDTVMVYNGEVFNHYELRRELEAQGERFRTTSDTEILLRLLDRDGPEALHRCNGQWGIAHLDRAHAHAHADARPLRRAPAALRAACPTAASSSRARSRASSPPGLVEAAPDLEGIDEVFTFWAAAPAALRVQGHPPAASRPPARVARRRDRRGARLVGAALRGRRARAPRPRSSASCCATPCGCACAPTSPSAATSRAASTRA